MRLPLKTISMKFMLFIAISSLFLSPVSAEEPVINSSSFLSTWRVPASDKSITLPLVSGYNYNFVVDWGDGQTSTITSYDDPDRIHTYEAAGDYNLVIKGILEAWSFNNSGDKDKIISVEDFGDLGYKNLSGAFFGCTNLGSFEGGVTSDVTNMASMFLGATQANPNVTKWNVSSVTNMFSMFDGATQANPNVTKWNVSSVTNMFSMFDGATQANPNVSEWDVSSVTSMNYMFYGATQANPDVSEWDVSSVLTMRNMFHGSGLTTANYDALLLNLADNNASVKGVVLGALGVQYSSGDAKTARDTLLECRRWRITDGGDATP